MSTPGEILVETLASVYTYSAPRRHPSVTTSTTPYSPTLAPTLNRVPAFLRLARGLDDRLISSLSHTFTSDIETRSIRVDAIEKMCRNFDDDVEPTFSSMKITTEADVTHVMSYVARDVSGITFKGYRCSLQDQVKHPLIDQTPDHVLTYNGTRRVVWEDEGWSVFEHCAPSIVALARAKSCLSIASAYLLWVRYWCRAAYH
ncbi:hypothetical protein BDZ89DRAFT_303575 [Hymenopellis radicata]|nr:hypothetical protein BDZ89DRAFT_303575 [Hymenopellis radicata]